MKTGRVNNVNFSMAWNKNAKKGLSIATAKLWHGQDDAVELINKLEHHSPHHTLDYSNSFFSAEKNSIYGENFCVKNGFRKGLNALQNFIVSQNDEIPVLEQFAHKFENSLRKFAKEDIFDAGLKIPKEFLPEFAADLSKNILKKPTTVKFEETVKLLDEIDKKAKATDSAVRILPYRYYIKSKFSPADVVNVSNGEFKTLTTINEKLDKIAERIEQEKSTEDMIFRNDMKRNAYYEKKEAFLSKIKNSEMYKILRKIKEITVKPFEILNRKKAEKSAIAQNEIAKKLDI